MHVILIKNYEFPKLNSVNPQTHDLRFISQIPQSYDDIKPNRYNLTKLLSRHMMTYFLKKVLMLMRYLKGLLYNMCCIYNLNLKQEIGI